MKIVKITPKMRKMYADDLLRACEAVNEYQNKAYPEHVYMADEDYEALRKYIYKNERKSGMRSARRTKTAVEFHLLGLGPNTTLAKAIRPGYILVDTEAIKLELVDQT